MKKSSLFLLIFLCHSLLGDTPIFVLHSYHESYPWTKNQQTAFRTVLNSSPDLYPIYSTEYLDTKRRDFNPSYEKDFVDYLSSKYKGYRPSIIYVSDDNALNFMLHNKEKLFPSVPVVFSGVNDLLKKDSLKGTTYTGIFEKKEILPTLKLITTLFPEEKEVLIIGDGATSAQITQVALEHDAIGFKGLTSRFINNPNFDLILDQLKNYKGKTVVLTSIGGFRRKNGELISLKHTIKKIIESGDHVILSLEDNYIQQGVLGGYATDGNNQGTKAGKLALSILTNPDAPLPETQTDTNSWIFDTQVLEPYAISLPEEIASQSTFLNSSKTFFQKHQELLITLLYGLSAALFIGFLLFNRYLYRSRKQISHRKETLKKLSESLNTAQKIAHLGNWEWDIKANTLWWSDEIYRIFGLEVQQFAATYEAFLERIHPDDREKVQDAVNRSLVNGTDYRVEHRIIKPNGTIRNVLEEGRTHKDEEGNPLRMIGIVHDITEQLTVREALKESERKYRSLIENAMIGIYRCDLSGMIQYVNPALVSILACNSAEEMLGKNISQMVNSSQVWETFTQELLRNNSQLSNYELTAYDKNGTSIPVMMNATFDGETLTGMMIDLREMKKSREEIDKLSKAIEQIDDTVTITDKDGVITYVNQAFFLHTGYSKEETLGQTLKLLKSGKHEKTFYETLWNTILRGEIFRGTLINRKKNGDLYYENKTITPLKDDLDNITGFVTTGKDVTLEILMHQELEQIATTDKLTGIYNRHKFEELFTLEAERSRRFSLPLSMILIDIDHFKSINDTYGHDTGDEVLKQFCTIINENIRKIDIFARWGGEEFLVLSPGTDLENIQKMAGKLRLAVENSTFVKTENVTISLGVGIFKEKDTFSTLFQRADQGLYHAKQHGRNQVGVIA